VGTAFKAALGELYKKKPRFAPKFAYLRVKIEIFRHLAPSYQLLIPKSTLFGSHTSVFTKQFLPLPTSSPAVLL